AGSRGDERRACEMNVRDSSVLVQTFRRAARTSVIVAGFSAIGRWFRRLDQAIANAAAGKESPGDSARARAIIADSRVVQALERLFSAPSLAWQDSKVRPIVESIRDNVRQLQLAERVRLIGWMIVVAVVTRAALFVLIGNRPSVVTL